MPMLTFAPLSPERAVDGGAEAGQVSWVGCLVVVAGSERLGLGRRADDKPLHALGGRVDDVDGLLQLLLINNSRVEGVEGDWPELAHVEGAVHA